MSDFSLQVFGRNTDACIVHDFAIAVEQEFEIVPADFLTWADWVVWAKVGIDWVGVSSIDWDFFEDWELGSFYLDNEILDLTSSLELLVTEIAWRERENLKAIILVIVVKLDQRLVVPVCVTAFTCDVDDDDALFVFQKLT